jgi:surfeit locus 1 family protein
MVQKTGLTPRQWLATVVVILGCAVLVRLGLWQLDRHAQRQEFNSRVGLQQILPPLTLDSTAPMENLEEMEYRSVTVRGEYNFDDQVALANQAWENQSGVHLITPLNVEGADFSVLVDRGWIPLEDSAPGNWAKYDESGPVVVSGIIRRSTIKPDFGNKSDPVPTPGETPLKEWNLLTVARIDQQVAGDLIPVYVQQSPVEGRDTPPFPSETEVELSEGPHLGYAAQWFMFALILGLGYPIYLHRQRGAGNDVSADYVRRSRNV